MDTPNGTTRVHAMILMSAVDLPARAIVANMKQFNGKYGCIFCEDEGVTSGQCHLVRYWPMVATSTTRSHDSIMDCAQIATLRKDVVCDYIHVLYMYMLHHSICIFNCNVYILCCCSIFCRKKELKGHQSLLFIKHLI